MQGKSIAKKMELCVQHCVRQTQRGSACHLNIFGLFPHFEFVPFCIRIVLSAVARVNTASANSSISKTDSFLSIWICCSFIIYLPAIFVYHRHLYYTGGNGFLFTIELGSFYKFCVDGVWLRCFWFLSVVSAMKRHRRLLQLILSRFDAIL